MTDRERICEALRPYQLPPEDDTLQRWLDSTFSAEQASDWISIGCIDPTLALSLHSDGIGPKRAKEIYDRIRHYVPFR
jgi:hypothetical protein